VAVGESDKPCGKAGLKGLVTLYLHEAFADLGMLVDVHCQESLREDVARKLATWSLRSSDVRQQPAVSLGQRLLEQSLEAVRQLGENRSLLAVNRPFSLKRSRARW
jgi:hypothetical protein